MKLLNYMTGIVPIGFREMELVIVEAHMGVLQAWTCDLRRICWVIQYLPLSDTPSPSPVDQFCWRCDPPSGCTETDPTHSIYTDSKCLFAWTLVDAAWCWLNPTCCSCSCLEECLCLEICKDMETVAGLHVFQLLDSRGTSSCQARGFQASDPRVVPGFESFEAQWHNAWLVEQQSSWPTSPSHNVWVWDTNMGSWLFCVSARHLEIAMDTISSRVALTCAPRNFRRLCTPTSH